MFVLGGGGVLGGTMLGLNVGLVSSSCLLGMMAERERMVVVCR